MKSRMFMCFIASSSMLIPLNKASTSFPAGAENPPATKLSSTESTRHICSKPRRLIAMLQQPSGPAHFNAVRGLERQCDEKRSAENCENDAQRDFAGRAKVLGCSLKVSRTTFSKVTF
eukprot:1134256-Rhodomonas_salina.2